MTTTTDSVATRLATYLAANTVRDALVSSHRHLIAVARRARLAGDAELARQCLANAATYRRELVAR